MTTPDAPTWKDCASCGNARETWVLNPQGVCPWCEYGPQAENPTYPGDDMELAYETPETPLRPGAPWPPVPRTTWQLVKLGVGAAFLTIVAVWLVLTIFVMLTGH